jgi:uncharacterized protein (TIGR00730 family)
MQQRNRKPVNSALQKRIEELVASRGGGYNEDLVADMIGTSLKLLKDVKHRGDVRIIQTALRELRYAFKLFEPYAGVRKVAIFGSARTRPQKPEYKQAVEFARRMVEAGFMVITGAGPGIMQAGHEGAGPEKSFGANIRLPWEQSANPVILQDKKLVTFKYFFTRKLTFIRQSDALALFPGGFGTLDEGFEALTLMQTGKSQIMPLVLIDKPGGTYWKTWDKHVREHLLRNELISPEDLHLYQITDDPEQAVKWITRFYRNYHSFRYVKDLLVLRLQHAPSAGALRSLNEDFADIVKGAPFQVIPATPEEMEDEDVPHLPRLAFGFNRKSYGRLRELIDRLNTL